MRLIKKKGYVDGYEHWTLSIVKQEGPSVTRRYLQEVVLNTGTSRERQAKEVRRARRQLLATVKTLNRCGICRADRAICSC
jgi:hypothetical protein